MKTTSSLAVVPDSLLHQEEEFQMAELFATDILDRKYDAVTPEEASAALKHLELSQRLKFKILFAKYKDIFDGKLGCHPTAKIKIKLKPGSKPHWRKPYSVPFARREAFRRELDSLIRDGVLVWIGPSAWGFPSFIIPKKDNRVRWISDFRILNEMIIREPHTLPRIQDIMNQRTKYTFFTKIDLSMMFYCFQLDEESQKICVISLEEGNFAYTRLPMGVKISPDVAQAYMSEILHGLDCAIYMDDVGIWTFGSFDEHLAVLDRVLERFHKYNLKCNPLKCSWAVKETNFLGWIHLEITLMSELSLVLSTITNLCGPAGHISLLHLLR